MNHLILVLNCGSSSIKFALYESDANGVPRQKVWGGKVNGITGQNPTCDTSRTPKAPLQLDPAKPYHAALEHIRNLVVQEQGERRLSAVAHRVVHGGSKYFAQVVLTDEILADLRTYIPLAPLHQPFALEAIDALLEMYPRLPQVACFDTGFHHTLPMVEKILPINWDHWEQGVRRYGFHGLSYDYMSFALPERHGDLARGRTIVGHIGSGASLCAMLNLESVGTTLGFSALDGLMMGTRSGALDPGAVLYMMEIEKLTLEEAGRVLYHDSGLKGISGVSDDTQVLLPLEAENERVRIALALYVRRIAKEIAALATVTKGIDLLVFTAGVGENNAIIRQRVCEELGWLGARLDASANAANSPVISAPDSAFTIGVEPTNEEWVAAQRTYELVQLQSRPTPRRVPASVEA